MLTAASTHMKLRKSEVNCGMDSFVTQAIEKRLERLL